MKVEINKISNLSSAEPFFDLIFDHNSEKIMFTGVHLVEIQQLIEDLKVVAR